MSLLNLLSQEKSWKKFYQYKASLVSRKSFLKELEGFIENREYLSVCRAIERGEPFPLPERRVINKTGVKKKRVVYCYPKNETTVLKLLTHLMLRKYDGMFSEGLFSFRPGCTAKDAVRSFVNSPEISTMYYYKADISNYFNSIPTDLLIPMIEKALSDDPELCVFLCSLLKEERVTERGKVITEQKGIMAGTPLSAFYANLFLADLDNDFAERGIPYARYSDDIIVFGSSGEQVAGYADEISLFLSERGLCMNPEKECFGAPDEGWSFLGFYCGKGVTDISPVTVKKLKAKMRRKTRALMRWADRNDIEGEKAASAFIRIFNRKLLDDTGDNDLTWSGWFFSVINTAESLKEIDRYAQDCIRTLATGRRTKSRFNCRYSDMKALGYRSLVHEYYSYNSDKKKQRYCGNSAN